MNLKVVITSAFWGGLVVLFWSSFLPYPSRKCVIWCGVVVLALLIGRGILRVLAKKKIKKEKEKLREESDASYKIYRKKLDK